MEAVVTFLVIFGAHMVISFVVKVKFFVLVKWSYTRSPPNYYVDYDWAYSS